MADSTLELKPKIETVDQASQFTADFLAHPPQNAIDVIKVAASAFEPTGTIGAGLALAFPAVLPMLPVLANIFGIFGSGGQSIGELTLTAIQQVSEQIQQGFQAVQETIQRVAEQQAQRTIDTVLSGVDEIAKEQSAVQVYKAFTATEILNDLEQKKANEFSQYQSALNDQRQKWIDDVKSAMVDAQAKTNAQYEMVQAQLAGLIGSLFSDLNSKLMQAAEDGKELLEIQRQIDEINKYLADGSFEIVATQLVRSHFHVTN